jgi:hypothetical protein
MLSRTCGICGDMVQSHAPSNWHPSKLARRAERDMQAHMRRHSFAEVLRYEIRKDLDQVPDEERPVIVRDVYRQLLGRTSGREFVLNEADGRGVYSIDEVLGGLSMYRLWRSANGCGLPDCNQH